jgi:3-hydroxyacyl-CoA dehydrogenase
MLKIEDTTGMVIAEDTKATIKAIDSALLQKARLAGSVLEASDQIGLPMAHSQKLLEGMARSFDHLVAGRADMLAVVRQLTVIKGKSTLDVVDYGCLDGLEAMLTPPAAKPQPVTVG